MDDDKENQTTLATHNTGPYGGEKKTQQTIKVNS